MTLSAGDKKALSDVRFAKAKRFLDDARANLAENRINTSVNRSYYAALNCFQSLLIFNRVSQTLNGVRRIDRLPTLGVCHQQSGFFARREVVTSQ